MPLDEQSTTTITEPRRKRAKIVSACGECRRKKTKCNGEHPCRNCEKSGVPCVYPSTSSNDDKRNAPSKQALEAIEERLKTIEDMLRTIIKSQNILSSVDMIDPVVNNFLNSSRDSKSTCSSISSPTLQQQQQQQSNIIHNNTTTSTTTNNTNTTNTPTNNNNNNTSPMNSPTSQHHRLPSIRSLSTSYTPEQQKIENNRDLPPLGYHPNFVSKYPPPPPSAENEEFLKKRKR
jgi:hypothetical protein